MVEGQQGWPDGPPTAALQAQEAPLQTRARPRRRLGLEELLLPGPGASRVRQARRRRWPRLWQEEEGQSTRAEGTGGVTSAGGASNAGGARGRGGGSTRRGGRAASSARGPSSAGGANPGSELWPPGKQATRGRPEGGSGASRPQLHNTREVLEASATGLCQGQPRAITSGGGDGARLSARPHVPGQAGVPEAQGRPPSNRKADRLQEPA